MKSCDHDDFSVAWDAYKYTKCPICEMENKIQEQEEEIAYLQEQIKEINREEK